MNHICPYQDCDFAELTREHHLCPACNRPVYISGRFDFTDTIVDRMRDFTGRDWVFQKINTWLADPNGARVFFLRGGPGSGKSAIAARLVQIARGEVDTQRYPALAETGIAYYHFCRAQDDPVLEPVDFVRSLSLALASCYSAFADALTQIENRLENRRLGIHVQQTIETVETGGTVAGVTIEDLHVGVLAARPAFAHVVRWPLEQAQIADTVLILVDALDEALTYNDTNNIATLLKEVTDEPHDLPANVRVMVTGRSDPRVLELMPSPAFTLVDTDSNNMQDVERYAMYRLDRLRTLQFVKSKRTAVATEIAKFGRGNFLYARYMLDRPLTDLQDMTRLGFPEGLEDVYDRFLQRELARTGRTWRSYRPILGALVVARRMGLTLEQLAGMTGNRLSTVEELLEPCMQYLNGPFPDGPFHIYHQSFRDFLLSSGQYRLYPEEALADIVHFFWEEYQDFKTNGLPLSDYGLTHLAHHLVDIHDAKHGHNQRNWGSLLFELLTDLNYLEEKVARSGIDSVLADLYLVTIPSHYHGNDLKPELAERLVESREVSKQWSAFTDAKTIAYVNRLIGILKTQRPLFVPGLNRQQFPTFFAQQIHLPAAINQIPDLKARAEARLKEIGRPYLDWLWDQEGKQYSTGHGIALWDNGRSVVVSFMDGSVGIFDVQTGQEMRRLSGHDQMAVGVAVSKDNRFIISGSADTDIVVWDRHDNYQGRRLRGHSGGVTGLAITSDNQFLVSASADKTLIVWDLSARRSLRTLEGHTKHVYTVAITPDDATIISASYDNSIRIWNLATGNQLHVLTEHSGDVMGLAITPDGRQLLSASRDYTLRLWDIAQGELRQIFSIGKRIYHQTDEPWLSDVALSPDGRLAAVTSCPEEIIVFDIDQRKEIARAAGFNGLFAVTFALDGSMIVAGGAVGLMGFRLVNSNADDRSQ